ncbi:hypothetical protein N752_17295 [Desulforamulus aquiferis]|nr:hypothetical protein [Desulforamulus aquiferis]RYD03843.1 hypothetical protein N752_17295 [Desulforamulus aquiferis]
MSGVAIIDTSTFINLKHINRYDIVEFLKYFLGTTIYVIDEIKKGKPATKEFYEKLQSQNKIHHVQLAIDDLIEMARVPNGKKISDAELSCFVKARNMGCKTFCDDKTAIKYAARFIVLGESWE